MKTTCREIAEILSDYDSPDCTSTEKELVNQHLSECLSCQQALSRQRQLVAGLKKEAALLSPKTPLFQVPKAQKETAGKTQQKPDSEGLWSVLFGGRLNTLALGSTGFLIAALLIWQLFASLQTQQMGPQIISPLFASAQGNMEKLASDLYKCSSDVTMQLPALELRLTTASVFVLISDQQIRLDNGRMFCRVIPGKTDFSVVTPQTEITVVGTEFTVQVASGSTSIDLLKGKLQISSKTDRTVMTAPEVCEFLNDGTIRKVRQSVVASTTATVTDMPGTATDTENITPVSQPEAPDTATQSSSAGDYSDLKPTMEVSDETATRAVAPDNQGSSITSPEDTLLSD